ncbi:MAG: XTP/dITP diphosphatase [Clostridia bacterium]|nr:XTP/dITP diphosphatase [Clostridia bacterium]
MDKIVLASRNKNKIREMQVLLDELISVPLKVLSLDDIGFTGEIVENGNSFEENSAIKASVPAEYGFIGVADDSGLSVDALGGRPGIFSARYSGPDANDQKNNAKLIDELSDTPDQERTARYVCALSCRFPDGREGFTVTATCEGIILRSPKGCGGFGYDPFFYYPPYGKTMAEMTMEEKNGISHRGKAMRLFAERLSRMLGSDIFE